MAKKKTASKSSTPAEKSDKEKVATTSSAAAKKVTKKKTSKKTTKKVETKKVTKKTAKKATSKKTAAKKISKKTAKTSTTKTNAKPTETVEISTDTAKKESATTKKTTKKKTSKKTSKKVSTPKVETKTVIDPPKTEYIAKPINEMTIEERIAEKERQKTAKNESNKQNIAKGTETKPRAEATSEIKTTPEPKTDPVTKEDPQKLSNGNVLEGEKISGGLLALEQKAAKNTNNKTNTTNLDKSSEKQPTTKAENTPKRAITDNEESANEQPESDEEKKLSRSARRRKNKRKKKEQEKANPEESNKQNDEPIEDAPSKRYKPITATAILAEKQKENKNNLRKETGRNMLMNVVDHGEIRVAIAGKKGLEEIYIEKSGGEFVHGNIFKGVVENVEPNLQAAFVNIGAEKNGFLHVRDIIYPFGGYEDVLGKPNRQRPTSKRPPINHMLQKGQEILVQITREQVATKGPSLTTYISLPGRYLVLMPAVKKRGVSKKITNKPDRDELRKALEQLDPPNDMGYIIRTAGMGKGKDELQRDLDYLIMLWDAITNHTKNVKGPMPIYQESDLVIRAIRDYFTDNIDTMYIDSEEEYKRAQDFLKLTMPEDIKRAKYYEGSEPLFSQYNVEDEISALFSKSVRLKSGGELVIEQTEAMVAIDVNTGKFVKGKSSHDMVLKINKEAALEIAKQLRLRDMGGLVMIDFIDMESEEDRKNVENTFRNAMQADRAKTTILPISQLGIMEMTRQRMRQSLNLSHFDACKHCGGTGVVKNIATIETEFMRALRVELKEGKNCKVKMNPETAIAISNKSRLALIALEDEYHNNIIILSDPTLRPDKFVINK